MKNSCFKISVGARMGEVRVKKCGSSRQENESGEFIYTLQHFLSRAEQLWVCPECQVPSININIYTFKREKEK